jgi:hypothetical protein
MKGKENSVDSSSKGRRKRCRKGNEERDTREDMRREATLIA